MDRSSIAFFWAPRCSSWFPGILNAKVDDAWDGSWRHCFTALLYLAAKPAHVGVDVDGLSCPVHHSTTYGCQMSGHGLPLGIDLSYCCSQGVAPPRGCEAHRPGYLVEH
jgi:hypothetical protein